MTQVDARVVVKVVSDDVHTGLEAGSAERRVAGLLVQVISSEYEGFVGGEALAFSPRTRRTVASTSETQPTTRSTTSPARRSASASRSQACRCRRFSVSPLLGRPGGERSADHPVAAAFPHLASEVEAVGLAAASCGDETVDQPLAGEEAVHGGALFPGRPGLGGERELRHRVHQVRPRRRSLSSREVDDPLLQRQELTRRVAARDGRDPPAGAQLDVLAAMRVDAEVDRRRVFEQSRGDSLDLVDGRAVGRASPG